MDFKALLGRYYQFSKPGIVYANVLTALAGALFAARLRPDISVLACLLAGLALLIIGACAANNCLDRRRDRRMQRTAQRGLVQGTILLPVAITYAALTAMAGFGILLATQNHLTVVLAAVAYLDYAVVYAVAKRLSVHGTLVGCVSGAIPLVAGYTAVTGRLDLTAVLLFGLMVAWQMAHFFGIALYRLADYAAADIPVMPVKRGAAATKPRLVMYQVLFIALAVMLLISGSIGLLGGSVLVASGVYWLYGTLVTYRTSPIGQWGKQVFVRSLAVMLVMVVSLSTGSTLL